jgi:choline-glycine betaine transporter
MWLVVSLIGMTALSLLAGRSGKLATLQDVVLVLAWPAAVPALAVYVVVKAISAAREEARRTK